MSKRDLIYKQYSENGYPSEKGDKEEFAARFLGARLVGAMDSVLDDKLEIINGKGEDENKDIADVLSTLNTDQRDAVEKLLKDTCSGFFYWMLVKLRNFPDYVEINVMELNEKTDKLEKVCDVGEKIELHHRYFDWIEEFSDHIDES